METNLHNSDVVIAFCRLCHSVVVDPVEVLYHYAESLSPMFQLSSSPGTHYQLAGSVFSQFTKTYQPWPQKDEAKRQRAIRNIRSIINIIRSGWSADQREQVYNNLMQQWYHHNNYPQTATRINLGNNLELLLPVDFIIHCEIFRCSMGAVLNHFMTETVTSKCINDPASLFLLHCTAVIHEIQNN